MNKKVLTTGRVQQKRATRTRILEAAQHLLQTRAAFTLEDVAQSMGISRATIYRYFSDVDMLCAEAALSFQVKQPAEFVGETQHLGLAESLAYVQAYYNELAQRHEPAFRKYLSVVLAESVKRGSGAALRGARRLAALEAVMRPYAAQLGLANYERLKRAVSVLTGIEPMIVNKDINGLSNQASDELLRWALEMILKGLAAEQEPAGAPGKARPKA
jgi:AcrR family transcriptional regulator